MQDWLSKISIWSNLLPLSIHYSPFILHLSDFFAFSCLVVAILCSNCYMIQLVMSLPDYQVAWPELNPRGTESWHCHLTYQPFYPWPRRSLAAARLLAVFGLCLALALTFEVPALLAAHKVSEPIRPGINWASGLVASKLPWLLLIALLSGWC